MLGTRDPGYERSYLAQTDEQLVGHALVVPKKLSGRSVSVLEANEAGRAGGGRDGPLTCLLAASKRWIREGGSQ